MNISKAPIKEFGAFKTYLLADIADEFNIYQYFDESYVDVFKDPQRIKSMTVTLHYGSLTITCPEELPEETEFLVVNGNFTVQGQLDVYGFGYYYYEKKVAPKLSALIVTGSLTCDKLVLSYGDIAVAQNLKANHYIYLKNPTFERGTLRVLGRVYAPCLVRGDGNSPHCDFKNDRELLRPGSHFVQNLRYAGGEYPFTAADGEEGKLYTADMYYQYLKQNRKGG